MVYPFAYNILQSVSKFSNDHCKVEDIIQSNYNVGNGERGITRKDDVNDSDVLKNFQSNIPEQSVDAPVLAVNPQSNLFSASCLTALAAKVEADYWKDENKK